MKKNLYYLMAFTVIVLFLPGLISAQYCPPSVTYTADEDIQNVTLNTINNTSPTLCNTYTDYTSISTTLSLGSTYPFSVNTSDCEGIYFYDRSIGIWIDLNIDGDFDDAGEMVHSSAYLPGAASVLFTGSITIPPGATPGTTRMRIVCVEDDIFYYGPCDGLLWGEVEDYTVVLSGSPCTAPPTAGTATISDASPCSGVNFNLAITGGTFGLGQTYQWQSSPDNVAWANIPAATSAGYTTSITDTTYYRCIVTCSAMSDTTTVVVAQLESFVNCYCTPTTTYGCAYDYISNVTFESINNSTGCGTIYNDFTSIYTANVIQGNTYPLSVTTDGDDEGVGVWIDYDHSGTFDVSELILSGYTGNQPETYTANITIPMGALTGLTRMRVRNKYANTVFGTEACATFNYGEIEDYYINIQPPPANDGGLVALLSPSLPPTFGCSVNDTIIVSFTTIGTAALTSLDFNYSVNGGAPVTVGWTGTLNQYEIDTMMIGVTGLVDGDDLEVWVSNPNGVPDEYDMNDSVVITLYDAMNGIYTIGGASPDFATIADAVTALETRGLCGPVTMNIRTGTYNEQAEVGIIPGSSSVNTVTFQAESLTASDVVIDYPAAGPVDNFVFRFNDGKFVILNELTLKNTNYYSTVVEFAGDASDITVQNCMIIGDTTTSTTTFNRDKVTVKSTADVNDNVTIKDNTILGGEWAVGLFGDSQAESESNLTLDGNIIRKYYQAGCVLVYQSAPKVMNNNVQSDSMNFITNIFHVDMEYVYNGATVTGNHVSGRQGGFGINLFEVEASSAASTTVMNNGVYMGPTGAPTYCEGIAIQDCADMKVMFNSIHTTSLSTTSAGVRVFLGNSTAVDIVNNNIQNSGQGFAVNSDNEFYLGAFDYNNLYTDSASGQFVRNGTPYADLAALQSGTGSNMNSVSVDPMFAGEDLHTCRVELDNSAMPYPSVTADFDGDMRYTTAPDMGADEFITSANFTLGPDITKCPNDSVLLGAEVIGSATYYWAPYFQSTPEIYATAAGIYTAQVSSSCGTAVDSITIVNLPLPTASFTTSQSFYTVLTNNTSTNAVSYFWDFGDGNTSTDFEPNHVYADNGTYTISLTAVSACGDSITYTTTVSVNPQFAGVDNEDAIHMNIYPNPSDGMFNVSFEHTAQGTVDMYIYDMQGKLIYTNSYGESNGTFVTNVNLAGMVQAGTYIIRMVAGDQTGISRIVIK